MNLKVLAPIAVISAVITVLYISLSTNYEQVIISTPVTSLESNSTSSQYSKEARTTTKGRSNIS